MTQRRLTPHEKRYCANPKCKEPFIPFRSDQIYHSHQCRKDMAYILKVSGKHTSRLETQWNVITEGVAYPGDETIKEQIAASQKRKFQYEKFGIGMPDALM